MSAITDTGDASGYPPRQLMDGRGLKDMRSKAPAHRMDLSATQKLTREAGSLATRKIWLPRWLYDCLPYFYLTAGFAAFFATLYISEWFWVLPHYLLFSAACLHLGFVVYRRRRRSRQGNEPVCNVIES